MSTPVVFCATAFAKYLSFTGYHSDLTEEASDIANQLDFCVDTRARLQSCGAGRPGGSGAGARS